MKFRNHSIVALAYGLALDAPAVGMAGLMVGSVFPDRLDFKLGLGCETLFLKVHRGITHWPWPYIAILCGALLWPAARSSLWGTFIIWACLGGIIHILGDAMTPGGVPYLPHNMKRKLTFRLFKTGSIKEYFYTYLFVGLCAGAIFIRYSITGEIPLLKYELTLHKLAELTDTLLAWLSLQLGF